MELMGVQTAAGIYQGQYREAITNVLAKADFIDGEEVTRFEKALGGFSGMSEVVGCASGTDALMLSLKGVKVPKRSAVFVSPFSFVASGDAIVRAGCTPVFVDIDPSTWTIDPETLNVTASVARGLGMELGAVIAVDIFGNRCAYNELRKICDEFDMKLIADAAQSMGSEYEGERRWSQADCVATSFFPSKPLGGLGDGGAVLCESGEVAAEIRSLARHGKKRKDNEVSYGKIGINSRLDTIQAACLRERLLTLGKEIECRNERAELFRRLLGDNVQFQKISDSVESAYAILGVLVENRSEVVTHLKEKGIPTRIYYRRGIHMEEAFERTGLQGASHSTCDEICKKIICLPMHAFLAEDDVVKICMTLLDVL